MKCMLQTVGMLMVLSSVWLRAVRRMTINLAAFWGIAGILLAAAGIIFPLSGQIAALDAGKRRLLYFFGGIILTGGYMASLRLSYLTVKKQEEAIHLSLLLQEKEQISVKLDEKNEKNSLCDQYDGTGGRRDSLFGAAEENK